MNKNNRGSTDGAAAFSYGTDMKDFCGGEKNVLLSSLAASSVTIYRFSALVGVFAQLSTFFLKAHHAQILPEVRYRTVHSLCCCCYVHVYCDKGVAAMASLCCYVWYTVWCSMLIECHSGEALSYTKGHHSLVHSLPWCGIIQDNIVSAESNCEQDALGSLFSSTIQKHLVCSEGFDPGIGLLLESPCTIIRLSSISMPNLVFLQEALVSRLIHYTVQNMAYWPVWIDQHHRWMIRFPSAIVPACFSNLPWFFSIHTLVLVHRLCIYCGPLTRGFIEDCCLWARPLLMCSSFTRMLHMASNNDSKYGDGTSYKTGARHVSNSVNSLCLGLSRWPPSTMGSSFVLPASSSFLRHSISIAAKVNYLLDVAYDKLVRLNSRVQSVKLSSLAIRVCQCLRKHNVLQCSSRRARVPSPFHQYTVGDNVSIMSIQHVHHESNNYAIGTESCAPIARRDVQYILNVVSRVFCKVIGYS